MEKYIELARELGMVQAVLASPEQIFFDRRAVLKCRWGCTSVFGQSLRCDDRGTTFEQRREMVEAYEHVLVVHAHESRKLSFALLQIEKAAFFDGYRFAFAIRTCHLCQVCEAKQGKACPFPHRVRPCDQGFGIDVFGTVRNLGLPCEVLRGGDSVENRYGFVLLD